MENLPKMASWNDQVVCKPFTVKAPEETKGFRSVSLQKAELVKTQVVVGNWYEDIKEGYDVYFKPQIVNSAMAKDTYDFNGQPVIILPIKEIVVVGRIAENV